MEEAILNKGYYDSLGENESRGGNCEIASQANLGWILDPPSLLLDNECVWASCFTALNLHLCLWNGILTPKPSPCLFMLCFTHQSPSRLILLHLYFEKKWNIQQEEFESGHISKIIPGRMSKWLEVNIHQGQTPCIVNFFWQEHPSLKTGKEEHTLCTSRSYTCDVTCQCCFTRLTYDFTFFLLTWALLRTWNYSSSFLESIVCIQLSCWELKGFQMWLRVLQLSFH